MRASESKKLVADLKQRGYVLINNVYYPSTSQEALRYTSQMTIDTDKKRKSLKTAKIKSGWIDDHRNIKNKNCKVDIFMNLIQQDLGLEVWPEFFFSTERLYRLDYAIPVSVDGKELKIGIEVQGGIWLKGNSGHSSGKGIKRDMEKSNLAQSLGWFVIKITPDELLTNKTLELIKSRL